MAIYQNKRLIWAYQAVGFAPDGSNTYTVLHGAQSLGTTTTFNLEDIFEIGQLSTYDTVENTPDVEVSLEKVIDGYPLIYHLATPAASSATLLGRSTQKASMAVSIYDDTKTYASGTPDVQMTCSGLYVSSLNYSFPVDGPFTEAVTLVGSNKVFTSGSFTFQGNLFNGNDAPLSGIADRRNFVFGTGSNVSLLPFGPNGIPGIDMSGRNPDTVNGFAASIQSISVACDLGREALNQLGKRNPYYRYASFPAEVTCDIEVLSKNGDMVNVTENGAIGGKHTSNQRILIKLDNGITLDLGSKNRLTSVQSTTSTDGSNVIDQYSFRNSNDLTITAPSDPAGL